MSWVVGGLYLPVYRGHVVPPTVEQRRRDLLGFVYTPSRIGDLRVLRFHGMTPRLLARKQR